MVGLARKKWTGLVLREGARDLARSSCFLKSNLPIISSENTCLLESNLLKSTLELWGEKE